MTAQGAEGAVLAIIESGLAGEPAAADMEVLGAARQLATALGRELAAAFVAPAGAAAPVAAALAAADTTYQVVSDAGEGSTDDAVLEAAWLAVQACSPGAILLPDSRLGRSVAARIAVRTDADLVVSCAFLKARDGVVQLGRPYLSGKAFAQLEWDRSRPAVVTVAAGAFSPPSPSSRPTPELRRIEAPRAAPSPLKVLSEVAPAPDAMGVTEADVIVAGGAGVGGIEGFGQLLDLAARLGGTVAASRVAVDRGWMPSSRQVGLTGKSVSPRLYLAVGISGAPQHIAGIRSAGKVVAINQDPRAPIFRVADLAVVGDLHEVIPALLDRLPAGNGATAESGVSS